MAVKGKTEEWNWMSLVAAQNLDMAEKEESWRVKLNLF